MLTASSAHPPPGSSRAHLLARRALGAGAAAPTWRRLPPSCDGAAPWSRMEEASWPTSSYNSCHSAFCSSLRGHASQRAHSKDAPYGAKARLAALRTSAQAACALSNGLIASTSSKSKKDNKHVYNYRERKSQTDCFASVVYISFQSVWSFAKSPLLGPFLELHIRELDQV